jgi:hypothetical protein
MVTFLLSGDRFVAPLGVDGMLATATGTGHGVYLNMAVSTDARLLTTKRQIVLSGPWAELPGREEPVGSLLFVQDGKLAFLEMFAIDLPWPEDTSGFVFISEEEPRSLKELEGVEA